MHPNRIAGCCPLRGLIAVAVAIAVAGCVAAPARVARNPAPLLHVAPVSVEDDVLLMLLSAQFALQAGDLPRAATGFVDAAVRSRDPALAEEATRLALAAQDWPLAQRGLDRWRALAKASSAQRQAEAWIALGEGRVDDAFAALDQLVAGGDDGAWRLVAQTLLNARDKAAATGLLRRLATPGRLGQREANWVAMSQLAFKLEDKPLARELADATVGRFHGADGYAWSARLAVDAGDRAAARAVYETALRRGAANLRLRTGYAALLAESGEDAAAARVLAGGPQDDTTYASRAAYAARADDKGLLRDLFREIRDDPSARSAQRQYLLGQIAEMLDRKADALAWYRGIGYGDERWFDAQLRAAVVMADLGRLDDARGTLQRLVEAEAGDAERQRDVRLVEADLLARARRYDEASAVYDDILSESQDDTRALYARALFRIDRGELAAGERDLRRVLELRPDDAEALNALGYTLADHARRDDPRLEEALRLVQRALELKPDEPAIIDSLGWVHYRMGDLDAALEQLRHAHAKQPDAEIAAHLGEVLWMKGEREQARRVLEAARRRDPGDATLRETIRRLGT